ncbi:hypothetical protein EV426DRAFT_619097, partial [Tirmania nivea]
MCQPWARSSGHRIVYTRPGRPSPGNRHTSMLGSTECPATNKYEVFCALCGLGLIYRMKCANVASLEPRELLLEEGMGVPLGERYRERRNTPVTLWWPRNAIGIELDLITRTIGEASQVRAPHVRQTCERSHGNHIESNIGGDYILARIPRRTIPIPPGFAPTFNWDIATADTASAADTAAATSAPAPEKVTYLIHNRCHEILKLVCARENVPWDQRNHSASVRLHHSPGSTAASMQLTPGPQPLFPHGCNKTRVELGPHLSAFAASTPGPSLLDTNTTTTAANNIPNQSLELLLPALFTALHNLGRTPGKNYWLEKDYEFDSEADFPGLAESMKAYGSSRCTCDRDTANAVDLHTTSKPHLGIVSSRHIWPHLNPQDDRDEFCPEIDYTGAALVAVADPLCLDEPVGASTAHFSEGQDTVILPGPPTPSGSTSTSAATSTNYRTLPTRCSSPSAFIWSPSQGPSPTRINPYGPSTPTDPFTLLPPELLLEILTYLSIPHISSFRLSSRRLASFIHPTSELPTSYFRDAFTSGREFEFMHGLLDLPHPRGEMPWDLANILQGPGGEAEEVDWRQLYRQVQYSLEANPKTVLRGIGRQYSMRAGKWNVVVPRSPGLANRRRIWGMARRVAREMKRVMVEWE